MKRPGEFLLILLLSGCAALPVPETVPAAATPATIKDWKFNGRISLTQGEQGWHAGLDWENRADHYRLQVTGPLGQGALQLTGDARRRNPDRQRMPASTRHTTWMRCSRK